MNCGVDPIGEKKQRSLVENLIRGSTFNHDSKKFAARSMDGEKGTAFCFGKTATSLKISKINRY